MRAGDSAARWAAALGLFAAAAAAEPVTVRYTGSAYDADSNRLLYTEVHDQRLEAGRILDATVAYFNPQGKQIASKTLDFRNDPYVPLFRMDIPGEEYSEGITENRDAIVITRSRKSEGERSKRLDKAASIAADAGFHQFIKANLPELAEGQILKLRLAVAGHLDFYSVRVRRGKDAQIENRPVLRVRVEHDSVLRFALDPVELVYDPDSRRLLEYRGTSALHDPSSGDAYQVRIAYTANSTAEAATR